MRSWSAPLRRYIAGHAAQDIHERHYLHYDLPEEYGKIIEAIEGLQDPTGEKGGF